MKTFCYDPGRTYSLAEFEEVNSSTRAHDVKIDDTPISHFDLDSKKHLIPMPQTPIEKEAAVGEIFGQLRNWNIRTRQNGVPTSSQGGFNFNGEIRAPDVAFTPKEVYRALDEEQRRSFQGDLFSPTFAVEVEDLVATGKLSELSHKFKDTYFPAGLKLGWLIDPINKAVYVFKRDKDDTVRRHKHAWYDTDGIATVLDGRDVLPGFELKLWQIDEALSQVCFMPCNRESYPDHHLSQDSSESKSSDDEDSACPKCGQSFDNTHHLIEHLEEEHARRKRKPA
jgi:Uma2 family endonuclease